MMYRNACVRPSNKWSDREVGLSAKKGDISSLKIINIGSSQIVMKMKREVMATIISEIDKCLNQA
jgi:hypothetical protein